MIPEKNGNKNMLKTVLVIVTILSGFVGTYYTTASSMKTEMALMKQKHDSDIRFWEFRIKKLEAASPEKVNSRMDEMQREIEVMSNNFKLIMDLL